MSNSLIRAIKQAIADQLTAQPYFANIPVEVLITKDILSKIEQQTYPLKGVAIFIGQCTLHNVNPNTPGPYFDDGSVIVEVFENPTLNLTLPDVDEVGETAMRMLHPFAPLGATDTATIGGWSEENNKKYSVRRFIVNLPMGFEPFIYPNVPAITAAPNGGAGVYPQEVVLDLASEVTVAWITYTLDGSFPAPLNPGAVSLLPGATLTLEGPATITARAYSPGANSGAPTTFKFT